LQRFKGLQEIICNFESTLERMLWDRIVCSINDDAIQKKLLAEEKLTYKCAVELAQGIEAANKHEDSLQERACADSYPKGCWSH